MSRRILFICKTGHGYGSAYQRKSSGLVTSTKLVVDALRSKGVECKLVEAIDNNCIDKLISEYKPDTVVIEALWVVPEKFKELMRLHAVRWFVHLHSNIPFLASEGISIDWISRYYREYGIGVIVNCERALEAMHAMDIDAFLLPNVYERSPVPSRSASCWSTIYVGCFGAIRPMKNQLAQAMAAMQYARSTNRTLEFFINASRVENQGEACLKSIRALFANSEYDSLHEVDWIDHAEFTRLVGVMDISMQCSLSETFNIVTADAVTASVPVVVSPEIGWVSRFNQADPSSVLSIARAMDRVEGNNLLIKWNQRLLRRYSKNALDLWMEWAK